MTPFDMHELDHAALERRRLHAGTSGTTERELGLGAAQPADDVAPWAP